MQELTLHPTAREWPAFELDPPPQPRTRSSLLPARVIAFAEASAARRATWHPNQLTETPVHVRDSTVDQQGFFIPFLAVTGVVVILMTHLLIVLKLWIRASGRISNHGRRSRSQSRRAEPQSVDVPPLDQVRSVRRVLTADFAILYLAALTSASTGRQCCIMSIPLENAIP